jgi:hypothetical protein
MEERRGLGTGKWVWMEEIDDEKLEWKEILSVVSF